MGAVVFQLGLHPGLSAVSASLQSVRRADGHVERGVGVAQGRGEDVCGPQVRAGDEARYLHFRGVVALLSGCVNEGGDGVVSTRGLTQGAAGGVRRARVQDAGVAGGAGDGFRGPCTAQTKADRVNVLVSIQGRAMARIEPPQPRVIHVGVAKFCETRACGPGSLALMHLQQALANARVNVRSDDTLDLGAFARVRVFIVAVAVVRRDAPSVTRSRGWLVPHGWLGAREHVLPREVAFRVGLIKLGKEVEGGGGGECGGKTGQGFVSSVCPV